MKKFVFAAVTTLCVLMASAGSAQTGSSPPPIVSTASGSLRGISEQGIDSFKGIPYALPPVGALRWRPPQPAVSWAGVRDAITYGNDCEQNRFEQDSTPSSQPMSEDCLYLNVWAPADKPAKPAPVMVWIHGGGLTIGSGSSPVFDGSPIARKGVVLVTINYRLGRFGFFAHPALAAEHPDEPVGNYGLMDQIAALKWVKQNIAAFGGDPNNVTVFGQSSGGASVLHLMLSPAASGLFAKAIAQSGGGREHWAQMDRDIVDKSGPKTGAFKAAQNFAESNDIKGAGPDAAAALRALSTDKVLGDVSFLHAESDDYSGPMIDGKIIPYDVDQGFLEGREARLPLLTGTTNDELGNIPSIFAGFISNKIVTAFGERGAGLAAYYGPGKSRPTDLVSDAAFVEPARFVASRHSANHSPVWLYRFGYVATDKRDGDAGARHTAEIPYIFGTLKAYGITPTAEDEKMSDTVQDYWIAFARSGNPNGSNAPHWRNYALPERTLMLFGNDGAAASTDPTGARLDYIDQSYPPGEQ